MRGSKICGLAELHAGNCRSEEAYARWLSKAAAAQTSSEGRKYREVSGGRTVAARAARKHYKANQRDRYLRANYGLSGEEYWLLYEFQGGKCALCRIATGKTKHLAVDHQHNKPGCNHDPKKGCRECLRGVLCGPCNLFLGRMKDSAESFRRAIAYLEDPPWQELWKKAA